MQTIFNASSVALATILGTILQAPNRFLGEAKIFVIEEPQLALQGKATIKSYQDEAATQQNPNFAYVQKIVVARDERGSHALIVATKPIHRTVVQALAGSFDPKVLQFGRHGTALGQFFAPQDQQVLSAYLVGPEGRVLFLNGEAPIEHGKKSRLNATRWEFTRDARGNIVIQARSQTGKVYRLQNLNEALVEENADLVHYDQVMVAQAQTKVNDFISLLTDKMETRTLYGTPSGLYYGDKVVPGTEKMDIQGLCIDAQNMDVLITTRQGLFTAQINSSGELTKPQIIKGTENVVNEPWFKQQVNVQALIGPMLEGEIIVGTWDKGQLQQHMVPFRRQAQQQA